MNDSFQDGVVWVIGFVFAALFFISLLELICEILDIPTVSYRMERWSIKNPWYAGVLILLVAVLLAHFFLNPLPPPAPPTS